MSQFKVYAPLSNFVWQGTDFLISPGIQISRRPFISVLRGLSADLGQSEQDELFAADHWLVVDWSAGDDLKASELVNIFLLALWLSRPTKTHVRFRFHVSIDPQADPGSMARLFDHFQWIENAAADEVTDSALTEASSYFPLLRRIRSSRLRLANGLLLTLGGCTTVQWQVALICYAGAAEAILTYQTGAGIIRRLAIAYACLVESTASDRDRAFREFYDLYDKRSDIMHGRAYAIAPSDRLPILIRFRDALRLLWKVVIISPTTTQKMEASDCQRKLFFQALQAGYSPPSP